MIVNVSGDILLSRARVIVHDIAPNDDFRRGLAAAMQKQWPEMVKEFRAWRKDADPLPGGLWSWTAPGGKRIVSLFTQDVSVAGKRGHAQVAYLSHALRNLKLLAIEKKFKSMAISRLTMDADGMEWGDVEPHIHETLTDLRIPMFIYDRHLPGVKAVEKP